MKANVENEKLAPGNALFPHVPKLTPIVHANWI
jgi:hypothetical protein